MACCLCDTSDRLAEQFLCTSCGLHFHSDCLSSIDTNATWSSTGNSMLVRMDWQCPECKLCQSCQKPGDDTKTLVCDTCDKCYHIFCLRPEFVSSGQPSTTSPPNNGWKCPRCKLCQQCDRRLVKHTQKQASPMLNLSTNLCTDCLLKLKTSSSSSSISSEPPPNDASSKRASRHVASTNPPPDLIKPNPTCTYPPSSNNSSRSSMNSMPKHEHHLTSPVLEKETANNRKRSVKDLLELAHSSNYCQPEMSSVTMATVSVLKREAMDIKDELVDSSSNQSSSSSHSTTAKPPINSKKKQISKKTTSTSTSKNMKRQTSATSGGQSSASCRSRSTRNTSNSSANGRGGGGNEARSAGQPASGGKNGENSSASPASGSGGGGTAELDEPTIGHIKRDEEDHHAVTVILSLDDSITQRQDMCLNCGSFGAGDDGHTLSCSQCGQCYHTYCAGVSSVSEVMREKGWRCLDCTVCEGCGKATDESRLLLCDDCDISYHIYCLSPPLEHVPKGNWKCKWCVKCAVCGAKSGQGQPKQFEWKNNYTECALCNSLHTCHVCNTGYTDADMVLKCLTCERWSHASCSVSTNSMHHHATHHTLIGEDEAERLAKRGFHCSRCAQDTSTLSGTTAVTSATAPAVQAPPELSLKKQFENENLLPFIDKLNRLAGAAKRTHVTAQQLVDDGVYLTESGQELMKQLKIKPAPAHHNRRTRPVVKLTTGQQPIDSAVDSTPADEEASRSSTEDGAKKLTTTAAAAAQQLFPRIGVWFGHASSSKSPYGRAWLKVFARQIHIDVRWQPSRRLLRYGESHSLAYACTLNVPDCVQSPYRRALSWNKFPAL